MSDLDNKQRLAALSPKERMALFEQLDKRKERPASSGPIERQSRVETCKFPLSFAQSRLWFLEQFDPGTPLYNIPNAFSLRGHLRLYLLQRALEALVERHEILRTTFIARDGAPVQVIARSAPVSLPLVDLQALPQGTQKATARWIIAAHGQQPFDLAHGPLLRVMLLRLNQQEHIFLLTMHHIASDGWSLGILVRELSVLYSALCDGKPAGLPDLPIQYADFACWQRRRLQGAFLEEQVAYWKRQLADLPPLLLPTDRPRSAIRTINGTFYYQTLPARLVQRLHGLSKQVDASFFMVMLSAFALLLSRYTGSDDIPIGTPIANRNRTEIEGLIGFFVNTLVLRADLAGDPTFRALVRRVREVCLNAYAHQDMPFERLVDEVHPARDLSISNPLVQVLIVIQNVPHAELQLSGLSLQPLAVETQTAKFDLVLYILNDDRETFLEVEYNSDLFDRSTIERLLNQFTVLLEEVVTNPDQPLSAISMLGEAELQQILLQWNAAPPPLARQACLHQLFESQVRQHPDRIAVAYEDEKLTYQELDARANALAHRLHKLEVGPEVLVGLCLERSPAMAIGILAILKAGGAYVPLDPNYPPNLLTYMLDDADIAILLTMSHLASRLSKPPAHVISMDAEEAIDKQDQPPHSGVVPENINYVLYTSGSAGRPKGVAITHANVVRLFSTTRSWLNAGKDDVWTLFHSYAFDFSVWEFWGALLHGGRLVIVPYWVSRSPEAFHDLLLREQVSILNQTPSAFRQLLRVQEEARTEARLALRYVIFGGEALDLQGLQPWFTLYGDRFPQLVNMYGITETTVHVTAHFVTEADAREATGSVIGRPLTDLQAYILDRHLRIVPVGMPGELYIGGAGLARGYLHRPTLTAERFIPHPFSEQPGACLYRTGDVARYLSGGNIEYLGRNDQQVKIRGFRIELGEIEAALCQHPAIREAVVVASSETSAQNTASSEPLSGHNRLIAYVVQRQVDQNETQPLSTPRHDEQVAHWQEVFDSLYSDADAAPDPTFNIVGWNSSYTSQPSLEEEMHEWVDQTAERILSLQPQKVLEIGCGTGLLLWRVAPPCREYWGTDFSPTIIATLQSQVDERGLKNVTLLQREANNFSGVLADKQGYFDAIIINSVVQYFPHVDYLVQVLEDLVALVAPTGFLFLGDIRNYGLLELFHTSVQLRQASLSQLTRQLQLHIQQHIAQENELTLDPSFFLVLQQHLPRISMVEMQNKRGRHHNELTRFRYDVLLHIERSIQPAHEYTEIDYQAQPLTMPELRHLLQEQTPAILRLIHVPDARLYTDFIASKLLDSPDRPVVVDDLWHAIHEHQQEQASEPEEFWHLADSFPYSVTLAWSGPEALACYDVLLVRRDRCLDRLWAGQAMPMRLTERSASHDSSVVNRNTEGFAMPARFYEPVWRRYANDPLQSVAEHRLLPELREYLKRKLPDHMVPSTIMLLPSLPITPSGKLDRQKLPIPGGTRPELKNAFVAPRNEKEKAFAEIWSQVLGIELIGIHDNFFELGGDSLLSIRAVARAKQAGLQITARQLFQEQTIAKLANVADTTKLLAEQGLVTGPMPMMPAHRFNLEPGMGDPSHHSMAFMVHTAEPFQPRLLDQVTQFILALHDALRLRAVRSGQGWELFIAGLDSKSPMRVVDLSNLAEAEQMTAVIALAKSLVLHFDLAHEPLLRVALCYTGPGKPTPLIIVGHSLVVDMQSWQMLIDDFKTAYRQLSREGTIRSLPKTTSYKQWGECLIEYAQSEAVRQQIPYWLAEARKHVAPLPMDFPAGLNTGASTRMLMELLTNEETRKLQQATARAQGLQMNVILLTAVALSFIQWSGNDTFLLTVENHGREPLFDNIDLSGTIGTLAMDFPLLLHLEKGMQPGEALHAVNEQLHEPPNHGIGYSVLRYMSKDATIKEQLKVLPQPEVFFNYLDTSLIPQIDEYTLAGPYNGRAYTMATTEIQPVSFLITCSIVDEQLQVTWHYSTNQYRIKTVNNLAEATTENVRKFIAYLQAHAPGAWNH